MNEKISEVWKISYLALLYENFIQRLCRNALVYLLYISCISIKADFVDDAEVILYAYGKTLSVG